MYCGLAAVGSRVTCKTYFRRLPSVDLSNSSTTFGTVSPILSSATLPELVRASDVSRHNFDEVFPWLRNFKKFARLDQVCDY